MGASSEYASSRVSFSLCPFVSDFVEIAQSGRRSVAMSGFVDSVNNPSTDSTTDFTVGAGRCIKYELDPEEQEHVRALAQARHESYANGRTTDEDWAGDSFGSMMRGTAVEVLLALLYDDFEFDDSVSAAGDDGLDGHLQVAPNEEPVSVDVKSSTYNGLNPKLLVAVDHVESRPVEPDVYVDAYIDEDCTEIRLRGIVHSDGLCASSTEPSYVGDFMNYTAAVGSDIHCPMPKPDVDEDFEIVLN